MEVVLRIELTKQSIYQSRLAGAGRASEHDVGSTLIKRSIQNSTLAVSAVGTVISAIFMTLLSKSTTPKALSVLPGAKLIGLGVQPVVEDGVLLDLDLLVELGAEPIRELFAVVCAIITDSQHTAKTPNQTEGEARLEGRIIRHNSSCQNSVKQRHIAHTILMSYTHYALTVSYEVARALGDRC